MIDRRSLLGAAGAGLLLKLAPARARADAPIRIGEINSYSRIPAFLLSYRKGWELAAWEINEAGGVLGRELEMISRDDGGEPANAVTLANELVAREGVTMLSGGFLSNVGLAISDFAKQRQVLFLASEPLTTRLTWEEGTPYTWRLRPSTYMLNSMLAEAAAKLDVTRYATIAPNYEYGQSAVHWFQTLLKELRPETEFVEAQWPAFGKLEAGPTIQALLRAEPEAIYNATFAGDLVKFVREGRTRGLFEDREVVSLLTGEPEYLDPLKDETPEGWIVTGYPWYDIKTPDHDKFLKAYQAKFNDYPRLGSIVGYQTIKAAAAILAKANSTDPEKLIAATEGLSMPSPFGEITFRKIDHQSTLGAYVGKTALKDGKGVMVNSVYRKGSDYLPSDAEVLKLRPKD